MNEKTSALLNSPHPFDAYFKGVFAVMEAARQLIEYAIPKEILDKMNLDTLAIASDTYIDEKLRKSLSDLVYTCDYEGGKKARICVLFEHKSSHPGRMIYPQMGRYLTGGQEEDVKQSRGTFTLTIPILFYHGEDAWNQKPLQSLYGNVPDELVRFIPAFDFLVVNLQEMSREEILAMKEFSLLRNIFLAMKRAWDDNFFREHYRDIVIFVDENVREKHFCRSSKSHGFSSNIFHHFKRRILWKSQPLCPNLKNKRRKPSLNNLKSNSAKRLWKRAWRRA